MTQKDHQHAWVPSGKRGFRCNRCEVTRKTAPSKGVSIRDLGRSLATGTSF